MIRAEVVGHFSEATAQSEDKLIVFVLVFMECNEIPHNSSQLLSKILNCITWFDHLYFHRLIDLSHLTTYFAEDPNQPKILKRSHNRVK